MTHIKYIVRNLGIVFALGAMIQGSCYARYVTTIEEISVKCSPTPEAVKPQVYIGKPNTYLSLTTKGILVDEKELIKYWDWQKSDLYVTAACITPDNNVANIKSMIPYTEEPLKVFPSLRCERGQGITIKMYEPNDQNPNKYQYIAKLTTNLEIRKSNLLHKKNTESPMIVPLK